MKIQFQHTTEPSLFLVDAGTPGMLTQVDAAESKVFAPSERGRILKQGYWGDVKADTTIRNRVLTLVRNVKAIPHLVGQ